MISSSHGEKTAPAAAQIIPRIPASKRAVRTAQCSPSLSFAPKYLEIIIDLLSFSFAAVVMVYGGCSITKLTMIQTTASLRVPMGYIYVIVPVSGILIMMFAAMNAVEMFHHEFKEAGEVRV